ncbi:MAG: hypothetical protein LBK99_06195 [Opitutaceae bacterium]|jgi:hypothetical protein|nr:hypothetical protein [Opitutaceae bacterium]
MEPIIGFNTETLAIFSHDVLQRIKAGDATRETMVPAPVADAIKRRGLFGYETAA